MKDESSVDTAAMREWITLNLALIDDKMEARLRALIVEVERLRSEIEIDLFEAIEHGDAEHRAWLKEALRAWAKRAPVPTPRGKGRSE